MFLNRLANNEEKYAFVKLAYLISKADNNFMDIQKIMIEQYCEEMNIENNTDLENLENEKIDLQEILKHFKSKESKNIVLLEIMPLIYADNVLHEEELKILNVIKKEFNVDDNKTTLYAEWSKAVMALYTQAEALLKL